MVPPKRIDMLMELADTEQVLDQKQALYHRQQKILKERKNRVFESMQMVMVQYLKSPAAVQHAQ